MIPICLVTGFLGCGKTTFLRHVIGRYAGRKIVYLINDFASINVDASLLNGPDRDVVSIAGGSIFCKCLVTEFVGQLRSLPARFGGEGAPIQGVVIEASGIANPKVIADMLRETRLDAAYRIASVVAVVEPRSLSKLLKTLPNIRAQIEAADTVLLNKTDLFDEAAITACEATLRDITANARIIRTTFGSADLDLFAEGRGHDGLHGEYAPCRDPHFASASVAIRLPVDPDKLGNALGATGDLFYRVKGFVPTTTGTAYVDFSAAGLTIAPAGETTDGGLVMIAKGEERPALDDFAKRLEAGAFSVGSTAN